MRQQAEGKMVCLLVSEGSERGGVGWELMVVRGEGVHRKSSSSVGTCKSGERRVGTRPNDSPTALYKYSRAGVDKAAATGGQEALRQQGFLPHGGRSLIASLSFFNLAQTYRRTTHQRPLLNERVIKFKTTTC